MSSSLEGGVDATVKALHGGASTRQPHIATPVDGPHRRPRLGDALLELLDVADLLGVDELVDAVEGGELAACSAAVGHDLAVELLVSRRRARSSVRAMEDAAMSSSEAVCSNRDLVGQRQSSRRSVSARAPC